MRHQYVLWCCCQYAQEVWNCVSKSFEKKPPKLNNEQKNVRLEFARSYESWSAEDWKKQVMFSGEFVFQVEKPTERPILLVPGQNRLDGGVLTINVLWHCLKTGNQSWCRLESMVLVKQS